MSDEQRTPKVKVGDPVQCAECGGKGSKTVGGGGYSQAALAYGQHGPARVVVCPVRHGFGETKVEAQ